MVQPGSPVIVSGTGSDEGHRCMLGPSDGDEGEEPPSTQVVDAQLLCGHLGLVADDETQVSCGEAVGHLGHLGAAELTVGALGWQPHRGRDRGRPLDRLAQAGVLLGGDGEGGSVADRHLTTALENPAESTRIHSS